MTKHYDSWFGRLCRAWSPESLFKRFILVLLLCVTIVFPRSSVNASRFYIPGIFEAPHDDPKYRVTASGATLPSTRAASYQSYSNNNNDETNSGRNFDNSIACPAYHICHEPFGSACFSRIVYCREQHLQLGCNSNSYFGTENTLQQQPQPNSDDEADANNYAEQLDHYPCAYLTVYPFLYQNQSVNGLQAWTAYVGLRRMAFWRELRNKWLNDCRSGVAHVSRHKREEQFLQCTRQNCSSVDINQMEESFRERQWVCSVMPPTKAAAIADSSRAALGAANNSKIYPLDEVLGAQMRCVVGSANNNITPVTYENGLRHVDHYLRPDSQELVECLRKQGIDYELLKNVHEAPYGYENEFCTGLAGFIRCAYNNRCVTEDVKRLVAFGLQMSFVCKAEAVVREVSFTETNGWGVKSDVASDLWQSEASASTSRAGGALLSRCRSLWYAAMVWAGVFLTMVQVF